jgi:2-polyprenyl-3-methyl-5-hydroxy-6-metoxy-1,4-benzoquinol methylase
MSTPTAPIAAHFPHGWNKFYIRSKLNTDPLYQAVHAELADSDLPLLDIGCGLGLLSFYLRERGIAVPIHGLDYDTRKIATAQQIGPRYPGLTFAAHDARGGLPGHFGNVTILDILQFFTAAEQAELLAKAAARVAPGGKLVIRSGIAAPTNRFRFTVLCDWIARASFWMKAAPKHYPTEESLRKAVEPLGLTGTFAPLWGRTPLNNYLIVFRRPG